MKKIILPILIILVVFVAAGLYIDRQSKQSNGVSAIPPQDSASSPVTAGKFNFSHYGTAPEFVGVDRWLNSKPLTLADLKGKAVLIDFWTYSCINCIRTLPYVTRWYDMYKDKGFVVVGVHTPEFAFEKEASNVQDAIKRFAIHYPVAQDNKYQIWGAYSNQYWPAEYLIDQKGEIVYEHFGEGNYDHTENAIRALLGLDTPEKKIAQNNFDRVQSPEMYFEPSRLQNLTPEQISSSTATAYVFPERIARNNFALQGTWQFDSDHASLTSKTGAIRLKFFAGKIHMVASSPNGATIKISVDGKEQSSVDVKDSKLYTLFDSDEYTEHTIDMTIEGQGFEAFTFTFG